MRKPHFSALTLFAAGILLSAIFIGQPAFAQTTTAVKTAPVFIPMPADIQCELQGVSFRSVVGENGQMVNTNGSADKLVCWLTSKNPEQKKEIPLASSEITGGLLPTKDFGKLKVTPANNINAAAFSIAISRAKLPAFRAFLQKPEAGTGAEPASNAPAKQPAPSTLTTVKDKTSYAIGFSVGKNVGKALQDQSVDIDQAILVRGVKDALAGGEMLMTDDEIKAILTELQKEARLKQEEMRKKQAEIAKAQGEANKKQGADFLAGNKTKEGVVTLPSGLQYKILQAGTGPKPTASDTVVCNYRGTLLDGKEFDSSYKRGQPYTFSLRQVIKGWTEALQLMSVGSKWQLFVPSDLAYGERSMGTDITPNSTLIFEIELLSIKPPAPPPVPPAAPPAANPAAKPTDAPAAANPAAKPGSPDASTEKPKP